MGTLIIFIVVIIAFFYILSNTEITTGKQKSVNKAVKDKNINNKQEAKAIAAKVKTLRGIEALETKLEKLEEQYQYSDEESADEKYNNKIDILTSAIDIAYNKPYRYYYCEEPDADTELQELKLIGKLLTPKQFNELNEEIQEKFDFVSFYETDEAKEIADEYLTDEVKELIKFRKIVESDLPEEEKAKKFNRLVSKSEYLLDELDLNNKPELEEYDNKFDASLYGQYIKRFKE